MTEGDIAGRAVPIPAAGRLAKSRAAARWAVRRRRLRIAAPRAAPAAEKAAPARAASRPAAPRVLPKAAARSKRIRPVGLREAAASGSERKSDRARHSGHTAGLRWFWNSRDQGASRSTTSAAVEIRCAGSLAIMSAIRSTNGIGQLVVQPPRVQRLHSAVRAGLVRGRAAGKRHLAGRGIVKRAA